MYSKLLIYSRTNYRVILPVLVVFVVAMSLPPFSLFEDRAAGMLQLHLLLELFAVIVAILIAVVSWHDLKNNPSSFSGILLAGFSIVAILDVVHALSYAGMPKLIIENSTHRAIFFWLAGRTVVAFTLLLVVLQIRALASRWTWFVLALMFSAATIWVGTFGLDLVPNTFEPGIGVTAFKRNFEYFLCGMDVLLFVLFILRATPENQRQFFAFATSCLVMGLGELVFSSYSAPSDFLVMFGHVFKVVSYAFLYCSIFVLAIQLPYQRLSESEQAIAKSEERFALAMQGASDGLWDWDLLTGEVYYSPRWKEMLGYQDGEIGSRRESAAALIHPDDKDRMFKAVEDYMNGRTGGFSIEMRMRHKEGYWVDVLSRAFLVRRKSDGQPARLIGTHVDITARKQMEDSMRLYSQIYQSSAEAVLITDQDNLIVDINPAFTHQTGYTLEDILGKNPRLLQSGHYDKAMYQEMWQSILNEGHWQGELSDRHKDGSLHIKFTNISAIRHADGSIYRYVAQFFDITDRKQKEELIWRQANYDDLTGLPNRRLFQNRLEHETKKAHRIGSSLALLFIDLDRFKEINDAFGHVKGDLLLMEAARRISACVREIDTVTRLGGDEFTVILTEIAEREYLDRIAQDIIQTLCKPFDLGREEKGYVSASIGIVLYPEDAQDMEELMKRADQAMYSAKAQGRNRFNYFTPSMQVEVQEKMALTNDLRQALARKELEVYYQPIVEVSSMRVTKAEALLRWHHPTLGMVSPAVFIPLAEESGLILEIGEWVFQEAITSVEHWRKQFGYVIQVSVNKSPIQFEKAAKHPWMDRLAASGLPSNSINVEITEGVLIKDSDKVKRRLLEFRNSGIEVSIDDFGTGFSALSYLKQFHIDYLKIDRAFVSQLTENESDKALTEAIIVMAHKLGIKTIAEGVETEAQRDLLMAFGCDYLQGYLYSRPVPAEAFERLLEENWHI